MKTSIRQIAILATTIMLVACNVNSPSKNDVRIGYEMSKSPKRGVAFNFPTVDDAQALSPYISWTYNWGPDLQYDVISMWFDLNDVEFCPMAWNRNYNAHRIRQYVAAHPKVQYLLAFNEPNLTDQANMNPSQVAELWPELVALAKELNLKLVSPALNYGTLAGYNDPIKWMDEFLSKPGVSLDDIDAISLHCYMSTSGGVKGMVERFKKYGKPIWMTEFCAWDNNIGSAESQIQYMCEVLNYFEQEKMVERYAWFIPRYKKVGTYPYMQMFEDESSELTALGKVYSHFSSFDKSLALRAPLSPANYIETSDSEIYLLPSTQTGADHNQLMLNNFSAGKWVVYQISTASETSVLTLNYASIVSTDMLIYVDGKPVQVFSLEKTGSRDKWQSIALPVSMSEGVHALRIEIISGGLMLGQIDWK